MRKIFLAVISLILSFAIVDSNRNKTNKNVTETPLQKVLKEKGLYEEGIMVADGDGAICSICT